MEQYLKQAREYRKSEPLKAIAELDKIDINSVADREFLVKVYQEYISIFIESGQMDLISQKLEGLEPLISDDNALISYYNKVQGIMHVERGEYLESITYFQGALSYAQKSKEPRLIFNETNNIGALYWKLKKYDKALEYLGNALAIANEHGFPKGDLLMNLLSTYAELGRLEESIKAGRECEDFFRQSGNMVKLTSCYANLGNAFSLQGELELSTEYYQKTLEAAKAVNLVERYTDVIFMIARNKRLQGEYEESLKYLQKAWDNDVQNEKPSEMEKIYREYSQVYEKIGRFEDAYQNLVKADAIKDDLIIENTRRNNELIEAQMEMEQKLNEKEQLLLLYARQAEMGQMIEAIAHHWRQPLNALSIILDSIYDAWEFKELDSESLHTKVASGKEIIYSMHNTIRDFRSFFEAEQVQDIFNVREVIETSVRFTQYRFRDLNIKLEYSVKNNCLLKGSSNQLLQVILIILNNASDAYHDKEIPAALVSIFQYVENEQTIIRITDNAGGISPEAMKNIFKSGFSTKKHREGAGIGLYLAKTIIELKFQGTIEVKNENNGAVFTMNIPLRKGN